MVSVLPVCETVGSARAGATARSSQNKSPEKPAAGARLRRAGRDWRFETPPSPPAPLFCCITNESARKQAPENSHAAPLFSDGFRLGLGGGFLARFHLRGVAPKTFQVVTFPDIGPHDMDDDIKKIEH